MLQFGFIFFFIDKAFGGLGIRDGEKKVEIYSY